MPVRTGSAEWRGSLKEGHGDLTVGENVWTSQYNFSSRFEEGSGTNPEELIGAAHAACFSMAFSAFLGGAGFTPDWVRTVAKVAVLPDGGGFTIKSIELNTEAKVPGMGNDQFQQVAQEAKAGCPVSRLYAGAEISLNARLAE